MRSVADSKACKVRESDFGSTYVVITATTRAAFETKDPVVDAALDPILFEHRDMIYAQHLELPLAL
jgi:hypothetical protein